MPHDFFKRRLQDLGVAPLAPGEAEHARTDVAAHPGQQRVGLPPGATRFDWGEGEVRHLDTDTVLTSDLPTVAEMVDVGDTEADREALRSVLAFTDVGTKLEIGGSEVPLDPCSYFPIQGRSFETLTLTTKLPAQAYVIASARSRPFSDIVSMASHTNRVGTYSGTPDSYEPVQFEAPGTAENSDFGAEARHPALHVQEFGERTWTVENTGANDAEVRLVGKATHGGTFVDVAPNDQPVTVAAGTIETITLNREAWHVVKMEARNTAAGNAVELAADYAGVNA